MFRIRLGPLACAALLAVALALPPVPAAASWDWALHCFKKPDIDVLHALIQTMLRKAPVGARAPWCSTTGRQGFVYLVSGGDMAGMTTATVRITTIEAGKERQRFVFRYRKDPARGWGVVG